MTRFSVVESVRHLIAEYRSFIKSSYRLADPSLREQFERHVDGAEVLVKGPYVTLARDFAEGRTLADVLNSGCGHAGLARLHWPFGAFALFAHQEAALRAVEAGRNIIVKTGTGSGKTEAFLLPMLSGILRMKEQGVPGTKAILLYPMNALANDQLGRMRALIRDSGTSVIRAFFEGGARSSAGDRGADQSGRVEPFCFCDLCGFATRETVNSCPNCGSEMRRRADVALIDSFEAEENTQITSAEDSRQRLTFERREHLLDDYDGAIIVYPYEFVALEFRPKASLLVTNWGRQARWGGQGEQFELCPDCGRHRPHGLTEKAMQRWDEDHHHICNGNPRPYVLGYPFSADVLVFPIPARLAPNDEESGRAFCRTLGKALVVGAQEVLEIEADEIAYFAHKDGAGGWTVVFYETAPGGAGYLEQLASDLGRWTAAAQARLFGHDCERACYRCLKSSRNQFDHALFNKELVRDVLFHLSAAQRLGEPRLGRSGEGRLLSVEWLEKEVVAPAPVPTSGTPIEVGLLRAIVEGGRLPAPEAQHKIRNDAGDVITIPDFAYLDRKIAIYCDGFAYHANVDTLTGDARKRNALQGKGWAVLTFWGRQILRNPGACEAQIWQCYQYRRTQDVAVAEPA